LKGTLDEGLRDGEGKVQQNEAILLIESHKWDPTPLDKDPRPIHPNLRWHLHGTLLGGSEEIQLVHTKK
jgi:hypothetical protein